jgi:demethylspheroidene O-methyltransferase
MNSATLEPFSLHERWLDQRDRWLTDPGFRSAAARFALTRPVAQKRARELFDLVAGFVYSQWLLACVELHLFDRMAAAPVSAPDLAREAQLPLASAERLLGAAESLGLAQRRRSKAGQPPRYGLGPLGVAMVGNPAVVAMVQHHREFYADLADPVALLREGPRKGRGLHKNDDTPLLSRYWSYAHAQQPGTLGATQVQSYSALMAASQPLVADQVLDAYNIARHQHLLKLRATLFDLPAVATRAMQRWSRNGLHARAQAVGGDFFADALPQGADIASLVRVIYDHDDTHALAILRAVRAALPAGGTLLLAEPMAGTQGAEPMGAAYFGMYLLAMGSGRSRTAQELSALLRQAGFGRIQTRRTTLPLQTGLIVAKAA